MRTTCEHVNTAVFTESKLFLKSGLRQGGKLFCGQMDQLLASTLSSVGRKSLLSTGSDLQQKQAQFRAAWSPHQE